jgi:branched-subunit amino acid transport protein
MDTTRYLMILAGMIAATFVSRYPLLYLAGRRELPDRLSLVLQYVPPAVLIAITVPAVLVPNGELSLSLHNEYLVAALVTVLVAWRSNRMLLSILAGMLALWGWRIVLSLTAI